MLSNSWNRVIVGLCVAIILLWLALFSAYARATLPQDALIINLKTAQVTLKKQYRDSSGALKESLIGRYPSVYAAKEAARLLPPLPGGLAYRIDPPPAYVYVVECIVPPDKGICTDAIDYRLHFVP